MKKYLLDTNIVSELQKPSPDENVLNWFSQVDEESLYISVITLGEIRAGIKNIVKSGKKPFLAADLERWLGALRTVYQERILLITENIAECWGELISEDKSHAVDKFLAATALTLDMIVVTRNVKDFQHMNINILNPFKN